MAIESILPHSVAETSYVKVSELSEFIVASDWNVGLGGTLGGKKKIPWNSKALLDTVG